MGTFAIPQEIMPLGCKVAQLELRCAMGTFAICEASSHLHCKVGGVHCTGGGRYDAFKYRYRGTYAPELCVKAVVSLLQALRPRITPWLAAPSARS